MPSQKPRIALTLPPATSRALADLADALGKPIATVATEMLTEMVPQLEALAKFTRVAKSGNAAATRRALVHMVGDNMADLMAQQQPELFSKGKRK